VPTVGQREAGGQAAGEGALLSLADLLRLVNGSGRNRLGRRKPLPAVREPLSSLVPSLRKRPGSPYYVACFTLPDGRPTQRSTKQTERAKAMAVCLDLARSTQSARASQLTEVQARKVLADILVATGDTLHIPSIRDFLNQWTENKMVCKAPGTIRRYQPVVATFLQHVGAKADRPLSSLVPRDIESFRNVQTGEGKSATTVSLAVKTLRIPLNLARRQGLVFTNAAEAVELPPIANIRGRRLP
jgi:hypothetical protein